ncbi:hypothetical protein X777_08523 [Ooceraea biroi]|uniref:Uncharacterized protein n=2 Tax=Ooceraea biroi TaxID=2015173 RepID=A0A026WA08_OOCBI|nr:hypothetical protein X777_08523 [Ooceraea biroi]
MTLRKEAKRSSRKVGNKSGHKTMTSCNDEEIANASQPGAPAKECKQAKPEAEHEKNPDPGRSPPKEGTSKGTDGSPSGKLERRASLRRKFGALLRGSADLPAAINRGLQPIRRSLSFSKDLHRSHESLKQPYRTSSVQWYNSLSSLAEDEHVDEIDTSYRVANASEQEIFDGRVQVTRTRSLVEKNPATSLRRRVNILSHPTVPPYGRHSDYYHSNIDLSNPPCEASSLPVLSRTIDADDGETKLP